MSFHDESSGTKDKVPISLHNEVEYFQSVVEDINKTTDGSEITMSTMNLDMSDHNTISVIHALGAASSRGASVFLAVDSFAYLDKKRGPLSSARLAKKHQSVVRQQLDDFESLGNTITAGFTNQPSSTVVSKYTGRSHIKSATVDDRTYIGGISLDSTSRLDAMASVDDGATAEWVGSLNKQSIKNRNIAEVLQYQDVSFGIDDDTKLLADAGIRGQSVILDEAIDIIDSAEERLVYASEQFPTGLVGRHLVNAHRRGVDITIASNHPSKHDRYQHIHELILKNQRRHKPAEFFAYQIPQELPTLHTKVVASETRATIGSHNLNSIGVLLGTPELNIATSNSVLASAIGNFVLRQIGQNLNI